MIEDARNLQQRLWDQWGPHYDAEHHDDDPTPAAAFLAEAAQGRPALELAVGTGRVALALARLGVPVTGIDISPAMADQLSALRGDLPVTVLLGDMADVDTGGEKFPLIYTVFSGYFFLMTQDRQVECFRNVARALEPAGSFVLDAVVPRSPGILDGRQGLTVRALGDDHLSLSATTTDPSTQTVRFQEVRITAAETRLLPVVMRYAHPSELDLMARLAGMRLTHRYGTWTRGPYTGSSPRHISIYQHA